MFASFGNASGSIEFVQYHRWQRHKGITFCTRPTLNTLCEPKKRGRQPKTWFRMRTICQCGGSGKVKFTVNQKYASRNARKEH